ncbi:MAG: urea ABC transporter ATP-binding subunit UrtE [Sneathiellaceae bacterium]
MLELSGIAAYYGNSRAIHDVSLTVRDGDFVSVLGRNGVGKTTLMRAIVGLMDRCEGSIRLDGEEILRRPAHERSRAGIGYVPQGRGILPRFTVRENLMLGTFASARPGQQVDDWVLDLFPVLREFMNRRGGNLSGGQQQQLAIARALLTEPKVILLDEPTEGIQPNIVEQIEEVLLDLNRSRGITIVLVEQNVEFARRASRNFLLMDRGSVAAQGSVDELTDDLVDRYMTV